MSLEKESQIVSQEQVRRVDCMVIDEERVVERAVDDFFFFL